MNTPKEIHIGLVLFDPHYIYLWAVTVNCLKMEAIKRGIKLTVVPVRSIKEQVAALKSLLAKGVDALIIKPIDSNDPDLITLVRSASAMNVPIVALDAAIHEATLTTTVGPDNAKGQATVAEYIFESLGGRGKVAYLQGDQRSEAGRARTKGFRQVLSRYPDIELSYETELDWCLLASRRTAGADLTRPMLASHPDLDAIICGTDDAALGVMDVLAEAGLPNQPLVCGFDGTPDALLALVSGNITATIRHSPIALASNTIDALLGALSGEKIPALIVNDMELVTAANVCKASISSLQMMPGIISMLLDSDEGHRKLHAVANAVSSIRDLNQMMQNVVDVVHGSFELHSAILYRVEHPAPGSSHPLKLKRQASSGSVFDASAVTESLTPSVDTLLTACLQDKQSHVGQELDNALQPPDSKQVRSSAVFPLIVAEEIVGMLDVQSLKANAFDDDTVMLLQGIADQVAVALENAKLYSETMEAYQALRENQERLLTSEKMASLGRLSAGIAHEMNTPLAAVRSALSEMKNLIEEYRESLDDPQVNASDHEEIVREMEEALALATRSAEHASGFVKGIKSQTRELSTQQLIWFNPLPFIEETLLMLRHALRSRNCTLVFSPGTHPLELYGAPPRLAQVLTNLISNAIDANEGGTINLALAVIDDYLEIKISDNGCGIPEDLISKIFEPMFTTKPFGQGTGLGLTIVHGIVTTEFNGSITVESKPGIGTTFTLHLAIPHKNSI